MRPILSSLEAEYRRYKLLAEAAVHQLDDDQLSEGSAGVNSIATLMWHISGNLSSRFTDFLTSDGEKPWRERESEFLPRRATKAEILAQWEQGWDVLFGSLESLRDSDLMRSVTIRGSALLVPEALHRSLAHVAYHVGQIVFVAKAMRGGEWEYLSIPPERRQEK